jgi:DNA-binding PadR family transcriptional regulator
MQEKDSQQIKPPQLDRKFHRLLTYSKVMSLTILSIYKEDGYPYKYLINDLGIMEGVAKPNIQYLEKNGFIVKIQEEPLIVYKITDSGIKALENIISWFDAVENYNKEVKL